MKPLRAKKASAEPAPVRDDDWADTLWHKETDPQRAGEKMLAVAKAIEDAQGSRRRRNLDHAKLYANQDLASLYDTGVASLAPGAVYLSINVTESCINTLAAKTTRTRIRPVVQTERGKRSLRRAAEGMTQAIDGWFYSSELHEGEGEQLFVDGALFGTGFAYTGLNEDGEVTTERVLPDEMLIDETQSIEGKRYLRDASRKKFIHREVLLDMPNGKGGVFGDDKEIRRAIGKAVVERLPGQAYRSESSCMVPVYCSWHAPSRRGANDGRYIMAIEGATLDAKPWKRRLPFDFFIFQRRTAGIWGKGLAEALVPIQCKINELIETIDEADGACVPRIFYQSQQIDPDQFDDELVRLIPTNGPPGQAVMFHPGTGASPDMRRELETWVKRAYEITGVSMLSASAEKPEGISSAVALRELLDREDLRFAPLGKRWERFNRDIANNQVGCADEAYEKKSGLTVQVPGDKFLRTIDWGKVRLDREKFTITIGAASSLPTTPAARKQYAQDLLELQVITKERFAEIVDESGDVKAVTSMVTAAQQAIELDIEKIMEEGPTGYRAPDPLLDPVLARDMGIQEYAKARHEDVDDETLEALRRYIMMAVKYSAPQEAQAQQPDAAEQADAAAQGPPPQGVVGPPPPGAEPALGMNQPQDLAAATPMPVPPVQPVA